MHRLPIHTDLLAQLQLGGPELATLLRNRRTFYTPRIIRRRPNSRERLVYEVSGGLKRVHRVISMMLQPDLADLDDYVTGFRRGYNIGSHATPHCDAPSVAVADISSFFASIGEERVWMLFVALGAGSNVAMTLARLTTFKGTLPEGARSSPAIANLIGQDVDEIVLSRIPEGCRYTRYADDLAFSGPTVPSLDDVSRYIGDAGFELKPGSYRVWTQNQGPYVAGLFVGDKRPQVPRKRRRLIEQTLFYLAKENKERATLEMQRSRKWRERSHASRLQRLKSLIHSVAAVDEVLAQKYLGQLGVLGQEVPGS